MTDRDLVNDALRALGDANGIADFLLNDEHSVGLAMPDGLEVTFEWDEASRHLLVYAPLVRLPESASALFQLYHHLLTLNCLGIGSHQTVLSVHADLGMVLCHMSLFIEDLNATRIMRLVDHLLQARLKVLAELDEEDAELGEADDQKPPLDPSSMRV